MGAWFGGFFRLLEPRAGRPYETPTGPSTKTAAEFDERRKASLMFFAYGRRGLTNAEAMNEVVSELTKLSDRSRTILRQIVETYLETGEPVGARNLSRA